MKTDTRPILIEAGIIPGGSAADSENKGEPVTAARAGNGSTMVLKAMAVKAMAVKASAQARG